VRFKPVRKAVFPVAGLGTRFLPATKAMPKEMLPVVDKPLIQYAVEEAAAAGIEQMIFVTGRNKRAIEDHFDRAPELEQQLAGGNKQALLDALMSATPRGVSFVYVRQPEPLGLGHAVLCALPVVNDEPFAVILADDLIDAQPGVTAQLVQTYERYGASAIAVQDVPRADTGRYGIVATESLPDGQAGEERVRAIVEKPQPEDAPSTLAVVGRYVLRPEIFVELARTERGRGGEIQLTDAIAALLARSPVHAYRFQGTRFDCGTHLGLIEATIRYALDHEKLSDAARGMMQNALSELGVVDLD
jgi:UTP--glucose-1-phosphate uridylyltransferase